LLFGLSLPVLLLFYLLKVRRTEREVSSVLLWQTLRRDLAAHEPWQRLRWSVLLAIQLAFLALLTLALARPALQAAALPHHFSAIVVDTSASMRATDVAPSRFEQARSAAEALVNGAPDGATLAVIAAGTTAEVVVPETTDHLALDRGLASLQPSDAVGSDLDTAIRVAAGLAGDRPGASLELFSDAAYSRPATWDDLSSASDPLARTLSLHFHAVGSAAGNQAITALALRSGADAGVPTAGTELFAQVANDADQPAQVSLTLSADGAPVATRPVQLAANASQAVFFSSVPPNARVLQLRLDPPGRFLADKQATLVRGDATTTPVLLVTRGNLFLQKALESVPGVSLYQVAPRSYPTVDLSPYAVVVFDGYAPDQPPTRSSLLINPTDTPWLPLQGTVRNPAITSWRSDDPLLAYVDLRTVRIARASNVALPDWAQPVIQSNGTSLAFVGSTNGQRIIGLAFDLQQSNLPLASAFPIFIANTIRFLAPASATQAASLAPNEPAVLRPRPGVDRIVVDGPNNLHQTIVPSDAVVRFTDTGATGLYRATEYAGQQVVAVDQFAVDLFSPAESDLRPRAGFADHAAPDTGSNQDLVQSTRDVAPWLLLVAAPLLLGEWWWFHRR
jgi:hypothetical protein